MRRTLLPAAAVLLALTSCAGSEDEQLRRDLAAVTAEEQVAEEEPLVPVEVTADLVDPEGSTVGTAWMRDTDNGSELELRVAGLTPGTHPVTVHAVGNCDPAQGFAAVGDVVAELPGVLVLDGGVGTLTTLVGPTQLEELLAGDGVAAVVQQAEGAAATPPVATRVACAAFAD